MAGWALSGALGVALVACLARLIVQNRITKRLTSQIEAFLSGARGVSCLSVRDDGLARLENAVAELETKLQAGEERYRAERTRSAELALDISHQLKTPIAALRLYCEMEEGTLSRRVLALTARMERLVASLLTLEKLRADEYAFDFSLCSLADVVGAACARLKPLFPGRAIEIEGDARLRMDADWMEEALVNLIKNACEHTARDGKILVRLEQRASSAFFIVWDDGGGVPPDELPMLFHRFFRSSASTANKEGVGVGMAIARAIVEKHHGALTAENAEGGLKVTGCLPILHERLMKT